MAEEQQEFKVELNENSEVHTDIQEEPTERILTIRAGDVFVRADGTIDMVVLDVSNMTDTGRFYKVRLLATAVEPFHTNDGELLKYVNANGLEKLNTIVEQLESVDFAFSIIQGEVYTQNNEFFMEILTDEMSYINSIGEVKQIVGVRDNDGVAFKDLLFIKSKLLGNCDQYPQDNFAQNEPVNDVENIEKGE